MFDGSKSGINDGTTCVCSAGVQSPTTDDDNWEYEPPKYETSPWQPVFIAAGVVIYAFIIYYFWYS